MSDTILKCQGISKAFPGILALDSVDFELRRGEVHALCGENGAGKSTLIKIITGLYAKDSGSILYNGSEVKLKTVQEYRKAGISLIPQEIHLAQELTVAENISMSNYPRTKIGAVDWEKMYAVAAELQEKIGFGQDAFTPKSIVRNLSMGHQQLVEIMKAIATDSNVIAFDEPTSSLSDDETEQLFSLIRDLTAKGISIIYVSHRLAEIFRICDRVTVFKDGKYVGTKNINEVRIDTVVSMMVGRELTQFARGTSYVQRDKTAIEVENLYWRKKLKGISFKLHRGEILGLFGIIGSGRTETARILFGLEKDFTGTIKLNGKKQESLTPAKSVMNRLSFITEDRRGEGLSLGSSVKWNISMPFIKAVSGFFSFINHKKEHAIAGGLIQKLRIKVPTMDTPASSLSGGNQQKLVIAKWLGAESEIMIFDEPTRGIDVGAKAEIYKLIDDLASQGRSIILISSELPEIMALSDRILVFRDGEINAELTDVKSLTEEQILHFAIMKTKRSNDLCS
ncbi:ribose import ATP-binding protein RbsA 1 [Spirochaetia bacterium]|nr:ribose import ATP-binding protein RbsA 1 [Spirochaetia bacterium]